MGNLIDRTSKLTIPNFLRIEKETVTAQHKIYSKGFKNIRSYWWWVCKFSFNDFFRALLGIKRTPKQNKRTPLQRLGF